MKQYVFVAIIMNRLKATYRYWRRADGNFESASNKRQKVPNKSVRLSRFLAKSAKNPRRTGMARAYDDGPSRRYRFTYRVSVLSNYIRVRPFG